VNTQNPFLRRYSSIVFILMMLIPLMSIAAEKTVPSVIEAHHLSLEFPILDFPYNTESDFQLPSMNQSLCLSKNFYQLSHAYLIDLLKEKPRWQTIFSIAAFDFLSTWFPPGTSWLHEEWHRAVLGRRGIKSYNEVYDFDFFEETIAVSEIKDEDLINLKNNHPQEMVRLHSAGVEAQYEMNLSIEKDQFFFDTYAFEDLVLWLNYLNSILYIDLCTTSEADDMTSDMMAEEGRDISERDFTGLDFTAYVYDLFRPDEPYEQRGIHPSGNGIRRYIAYSDLTDPEKDYLKFQRNLSLLNLVNPFLFQKRRFSGNAYQWNATLRHHLTPHGYNISANLFYKKNQVNVLLKLHTYSNKYKTWPGLEIELLGYPKKIRNRIILFSLRSGIWLQPENQTFKTRDSEAGGFGSFKIATPVSDHVDVYIAVEGKTNGWVAGNVYLEDNFSTVCGVVIK